MQINYLNSHISKECGMLTVSCSLVEWLQCYTTWNILVILRRPKYQQWLCKSLKFVYFYHLCCLNICLTCENTENTENTIQKTCENGQSYCHCPTVGLYPLQLMSPPYSVPQTPILPLLCVKYRTVHVNKLFLLHNWHYRKAQPISKYEIPLESQSHLTCQISFHKTRVT